MGLVYNKLTLCYSSYSYYRYLAGADSQLSRVGADAGNTMWLKLHAYGFFGLDANIHDMHLYADCMNNLRRHLETTVEYCQIYPFYAEDCGDRI